MKDLLSVSRLEAGRIKIDPRAVDLVPLVNAVVDQLTPMARNKDLKLALEPTPGGALTAWADPDRTMEVLINLVGNSIKYTNAGSVSVAMHSSADPGMVSITVKDTGIGMSAEALQHLFQKFYRVQDPKSEGVSGTGLGLYITKQMVDKMGGQITVESRPDVGSTFSVRLPVARQK